MKTNRQTIWLVSMLSLMVILSAYYLFTEESAVKAPKVADGQQVSVQDNTAAKDTALTEAQEDLVVKEVTDISDKVTAAEPGAAADNSKNDAAKKDTAAAEVKSPEKTAPADQSAVSSEDPQKDAEVLKKIEAQGTAGNDAITNYQYQRNEENKKINDKLTQIIADQTKSAEESAKAQRELAALEDKEAKISDIEEKLQQQYANAAVTPKDDGYTVVVLSDKLEAKQAVSIVDLVIKELGVAQDKVRVQYVTQ
ncbi:SpoIIIAH-like family protein [Paenibacillus sp. YPG26]|uniref:SpoIIIAH-like family protein n=1 Tax=Paenibacillus sp. YPG26 TaxID=2878915 RepID=UPI002041088D|nr:SpoIIIAH-like family protein [Paenibacillus sp. YPG26]USB34679.1 SpoIIIAH-like family protein [Paenibacillus sp. YPG26]